MSEFLMHRSRYKNLAVDLRKKLFLLYCNEIPQQSGIGNCGHLHDLLGISTTVSCFVYSHLAIQIFYSEVRQRHLIAPQEVLRLDARQSQHLRYFIKPNNLLPKAIDGQHFQRSP